MTLPAIVLHSSKDCLNSKTEQGASCDASKCPNLYLKLLQSEQAQPYSSGWLDGLVERPGSSSFRSWMQQADFHAQLWTDRAAVTIELFLSQSNPLPNCEHTAHRPASDGSMLAVSSIGKAARVTRGVSDQFSRTEPVDLPRPGIKPGVRNNLIRANPFSLRVRLQLLEICLDQKVTMVRHRSTGGSA